MPIERDRYPQDWDKISLNIKTQAKWTCQHCGKMCRQPQEDLSQFSQRVADPGSPLEREILAHPQRFCLTSAHLNQDPSNNEPDNLLALCVPCHLHYDRPYMQKNIYAKRERQGQFWLTTIAAAGRTAIPMASIKTFFIFIDFSPLGRHVLPYISNTSESRQWMFNGRISR